MFRKILDKAYSKRYLVLTNTLTGVVSMSLGDILQQNFESSYRASDRLEAKNLQTIDDNNNSKNDNSMSITKNTSLPNVRLFDKSKDDCDLKCDTPTVGALSVKDYFVWDPIRTKNMAYAGVYFSLFGHYWYSFLDRKFPPKARASVLKKVAAECIMGPLLVSNCFFVIGFVKGHTLEQCWKYLKSNWHLIVGVEWAVYIPLQWLNFALVPAQYRYLYVASISLAYDAFLSYILHRNERNEAAQWKTT